MEIRVIQGQLIEDFTNSIARYISLKKANLALKVKKLDPKFFANDLDLAK